MGSDSQVISFNRGSRIIKEGVADDFEHFVEENTLSQKQAKSLKEFFETEDLDTMRMVIRDRVCLVNSRLTQTLGGWQAIFTRTSRHLDLFYLIRRITRDEYRDDIEGQKFTTVKTKMRDMRNNLLRLRNSL